MSLHVLGRSDIQSSVEERGYVNAGVVLGRFLLGFSMVEGLGLALKVQTTCPNKHTTACKQFEVVLCCYVFPERHARRVRLFYKSSPCVL